MQKDIALRGLTTTPSAHDCPDGDLAAVLNMVPEDGALVPLPEPYKVGVMENDASLWVHETPDYLHYIKYLKGAGKWYWTDKLPEQIENVNSSASITTPSNTKPSVVIGQITGDANLYLASSSPLASSIQVEVKNDAGEYKTINVPAGHQEGAICAYSGTIVSATSSDVIIKKVTTSYASDKYQALPEQTLFAWMEDEDDGGDYYTTLYVYRYGEKIATTSNTDVDITVNVNGADVTCHFSPSNGKLAYKRFRLQDEEHGFETPQQSFYSSIVEPESADQYEATAYIRNKGVDEGGNPYNGIMVSIAKEQQSCPIEGKISIPIDCYIPMPDGGKKDSIEMSAEVIDSSGGYFPATQYGLSSMPNGQAVKYQLDGDYLSDDGQQWLLLVSDHKELVWCTLNDTDNFERTTGDYTSFPVCKMAINFCDDGVYAIPYTYYNGEDVKQWQPITDTFAGSCEVKLAYAHSTDTKEEVTVTINNTLTKTAKGFKLTDKVYPKTYSAIVLQASESDTTYQYVVEYTDSRTDESGKDVTKDVKVSVEVCDDAIYATGDYIEGCQIVIILNGTATTYTVAESMKVIGANKYILSRSPVKGRRNEYKLGACTETQIVTIGESSAVCMYRYVFTDSRSYQGADTNVGWIEIRGVAGADVNDVTYNGNILVIAMANTPAQYVKWDSAVQDYSYLGQIPSIDMDFFLTGNVGEMSATDIILKANTKQSSFNKTIKAGIQSSDADRVRWYPRIGDPYNRNITHNGVILSAEDLKGYGMIVGETYAVRNDSTEGTRLSAFPVYSANRVDAYSDIMWQSIDMGTMDRQWRFFYYGYNVNYADGFTVDNKVGQTLSLGKFVFSEDMVALVITNSNHGDSVESDDRRVKCSILGKSTPDDDNVITIEATNSAGFDDEGKSHDSIMAAVNKFTNHYGEANGKFIFPFKVVYRLKMFDGTTLYQSAPQLMVPNWRAAPVVTIASITDWNTKAQGKVMAFVSDLNYNIRNTEALAKWKGIITDVSIGITAPIGWNTGDMTDDAVYDPSTEKCLLIDMPKYADIPTGVTDQGFRDKALMYIEDKGIFKEGEEYLWDKMTDIDKAYKWIAYPPLCSTTEYEKQLENTIAYYTISDKHIEDVISDGDGEYRVSMSGINTVNPEGKQQKMTAMDSISNPTVQAETMKVYNGRLHLCNVKEYLSADTVRLSPIVKNSTIRYRIEMTVEKTDGTHTLRSDWKNGDPTCAIYAYSKDPDIKSAKVYVEDSTGITTTVGVAYSLRDVKMKYEALSSGTYAWNDGRRSVTYLSCSAKDAASYTKCEMIPVNHSNEIYVSNANNPFYFPAEGAVQVGRGEIKKVAVSSEVVSEGQFGEAPLYAYTDEETWILTLGQTGLYQAKQQLSNENCINLDAICELPNGVIFCTRSGIMYAQGKNIVCISDSLKDNVAAITLPSLNKIMATRNLSRGGDALSYYVYNTSDWKAFLASCKITYDRINERLYVAPEDGTLTFVYSFKSKMWGMQDIDITGTIAKANSSWIIQPTVIDGAILKQISDISDSDLSKVKTKTFANQYAILRPLGFDAADTLKKVKAAIARGYFRKGNVSTAIYGSRNLFDWKLIWTSKDHYLRGFSGTPYKYYMPVMVCSLQNDERLQGWSFDIEGEFTAMIR